MLSSQWSALQQLTALCLRGLDSFRQEGGPAEGAVASLFRHLRETEFEVSFCSSFDTVLCMVSLSRSQCAGP